MFNFPKYNLPKKTEYQQTSIPADWVVRLDQISQQLMELSYQNTDLKRTLVRLETKVSRLGIALGHADAVSRGKD